MVRALTVVLVLAVALTMSPAVAEAACAGNMLEHDIGPVDRDGTIHMVGGGWGDNCYDTGEIPPGESVLGRPATDIEVFLVQDGVEHLVATGDADEKYGFTADVPVPDGLKPGPVEVTARSGNAVGYVVTVEPLVVSNAGPSGQSDDAVVHLGKSPPGAVALPTTPPRSSWPVGAAAGVALIVAGFVAVGVYVARRQRR